MTPDEWRLVGDAFTQALAVPESRRTDWLATAALTEEVRREVEALLEAHASDDAFLERAAAVTQQVPPPDEYALGQLVGPYRLIRVLGRGGMGVVFEAEDTRLHRRVALKALATPRAADAREQQRLRQEARAAAALVHPNIATIYALEEVEGQTYIVSELLEGETLRETLARGPLSREDTIDIACALASALGAAHARGIVHRDLKPENVLRLPDGRVKVLDFGLARFEDGARGRPSLSRLTVTGLVAGTPGYMPPEQLLGLELDARADQYALGALVTELATGSNPFDAGTLPATIARVLGADGLPRPTPGLALPPDIEAIVDRCLRYRPADRFDSTPQVVAAFEACRAGVATPPAVVLAGRMPTPPLAAVEARPPLAPRSAWWWWRFHQAAAAAVYWVMVAPAWIVHPRLPYGLPWFLACLSGTIVAANVRLHLRFTAAVLPGELPAQRRRTRPWVALADWLVIILWAFAGVSLAGEHPAWSAFFVAFAIGAAVAVGVIEPATTRAAFVAAAAERRG